jgi:4-cresol dehydrogenase (hydroxylating)
MNLTEGSALAAALAAWQEIGDQNVEVVRDDTLLTEASTTTFASNSRVHAVLRPATRDDVRACVRIANRYQIPIYPISTGKNWGYGSSAPVRDGVLLDLGRLNRIVDFDEDLAYVTIEPGVTQSQLFQFLRDRKSKLWMDATGASPDCSIVGNTLERGFGHTPLGDHCSNACGLEVVLPTGDVIQTGFSRFPGGKTGALSRWGLGPSLDGLFAQSNFGVVTRMTVWLMPEPEYFQAFFFSSDDDDKLPEIIDALRPLRLNGTLRSVAHIGNDYKVLSATGQYPWDENEATPLGRPAVKQIRKRLGVGAWNGSGGLYGTRGQVKDARRQLRRALRGKVDRLHFVDDRLLRAIQRFSKPFSLLAGWDLQRTLAVINPVYNLLKGVPTNAPMASVYWRKRGTVPRVADPDRDACGLLWCSPVVPNTGAHAKEATQLAGAILLEHGFEPQISISLASERSLICVITIAFDRLITGEDARAARCYRELAEQLLARGYPPYRLNIGSMGLASTHDGYDVALRALKNALDPAGILAPGRYEPDEPSAAAGGAALDLKTQHDDERPVGSFAH